MLFVYLCNACCAYDCFRDQWAGEITEWLDVPRDKIDFMQSSKPPEPSGIAFVIASYENVSKVVDKIKGMFEILILDESHMIKTPTVQINGCHCPLLAFLRVLML